MRTISHLLSVSVLLLASACTNTDYKAGLQQASVCCQSLAEAQYLPLSYDKPLQVEVGGSKTPARQFPEGKSYFLPVRLPDFSVPYELQIESLPVAGQLFMPTVLVLGDRHQTLRTIPATAFETINGMSSHKLFLNKDEGWRYLVLYANTTGLGKQSEMRDVQVSSSSVPVGTTGSAYILTGSDTKQIIKTAEGGNVTVRAIKYQPRSIQ